MMHSTFYYLHVLSALHVGTGQGAGVIDLPIVRERATQLPYVPGSSVKGVLREELRPDSGNTSDLSKDDWEVMFGPRNNQDDNGFAGAITLGDARLLCLPVRSLAGTFAWATCPFILARYAREARATSIEPPALPNLPHAESALVAKSVESSALVHQGKIVLEDLDLSAASGADRWAQHISKMLFPGDSAWHGLFEARFTVLPDGVLDFLAETATEVRARVMIDPERRVVAKGALWYEENLPVETLLFGLAAADRSRKNGYEADAGDLLDKLPTGPLRLQMGGKATVGRGLLNWIKRGD